MNKLIFIVLFFLFGSMAYAKDQINSYDQLQDNGWMKIQGVFIRESKPEAFYKGEAQAMELPQKEIKLAAQKEKIRKLFVKIKFLKPCKVVSLSDYFKDRTSKTDQDLISSIAFYILVVESHQNEPDIIDDAYNGLIKKYPEAEYILAEYYALPKYKCDYRNTVFVTFHDASGLEMQTAKDFPDARHVDGMPRQKEIFPGEITYAAFPVPESANSWKVWLPK